jgi:hypothetical protein
MFVVLSAGMLTGLTATGMSLGQTVFAEDNDKNQKIDQENKCKIEIENEHGDNNEQNNNDNEVTCQNSAQNGYDTSINGNPFSELGPG